MAFLKCFLKIYIILVLITGINSSAGATGGHCVASFVEELKNETFKSLNASLSKLHPDAQILKLVSNKQFNEALWQAQKAGDHEVESELENFLLFSLHFSKPTKKVSVSGKAEVYFVELDTGVAGIFKPNPIYWKLKDTVIASTSNVRSEVASSRFSDLLGLNLVPKTIERDVDGQSGSFQMFIKEDLHPVSLDSQENRKIFDYLINNRDRHSQNLLKFNGQEVGIDHGLAFVRGEELGAHPAPLLKDLKIGKSQFEFYENLKTKLTEKVIRQELSGFPEDIINQTIQRRGLLLKRFEMFFK